MREFYECPSCGFFHPAGFNGTCDDIENRFDMDQLEEEYPDWQEVEAPLAAAAAVENPNLHRLSELRPDIDLNGNKLEVGCNVRVYTAGHYIPETDTLAGIALGNGVTATEGRLEQIGFHCTAGVDAAEITTALNEAADYFAKDDYDKSVALSMEYALNWGTIPDETGRRHRRENALLEALKLALSAATAPHSAYMWATKHTKEQVLALLRQCANKPILVDPTPYYVIQTASNGTIRTAVNGHAVVRCTNTKHVYLPDQFCPSFIVFRT